MTVQHIYIGLKIIDEARPSESSPYHLRAEHDEIFAGDLDWPISDSDKQTLELLGWEQCEGANWWRASI